ncbi:hypothetical protein PCE1_001705 [Barthelona sp. PCE]
MSWNVVDQFHPINCTSKSHTICDDSLYFCSGQYLCEYSFEKRRVTKIVVEGNSMAKFVDYTFGHLCCCMDDGTVHVSTEEADAIIRGPTFGLVSCFCNTENGCVVGTADRGLFFFDFHSTDLIIRSPGAPIESVHHIEYDNKGITFVGLVNGCIAVYVDGDFAEQIFIAHTSIMCIGFAENTLAVGTADGCIHVFGMQDSQDSILDKETCGFGLVDRAILRPHKDGVTSCLVMKDYILSTSLDKRLAVISRDTLRIVRYHGSAVEQFPAFLHVSASSMLNTIIISTVEGSLLLFKDGISTACMTCPSMAVTGFLRSQGLLYVSSEDATLRAYGSTETGLVEVVRPLTHGYGITNVLPSHRPDRIIVISHEVLARELEPTKMTVKVVREHTNLKHFCDEWVDQYSDEALWMPLSLSTKARGSEEKTSLSVFAEEDTAEDLKNIDPTVFPDGTVLPRLLYLESHLFLGHRGDIHGAIVFGPYAVFIDPGASKRPGILRVWKENLLIHQERIFHLRAICSMNSTSFAVLSDEALFIYSAESGIRLDEKISVAGFRHIVSNTHDYLTNPTMMRFCTELDLFIVSQDKYFYSITMDGHIESCETPIFNGLAVVDNKIYAVGKNTIITMRYGAEGWQTENMQIDNFPALFTPSSFEYIEGQLYVGLDSGGFMIISK